MPSANQAISLQPSIAYGQSVWKTLHEHPELSQHEEQTSQYLQKKLQALGYEIHPCGTFYSFVAFHPQKSPYMALRAELDALPITEETQLSYASTNPGVMHACGHDLHCGIAMALAHYTVQCIEKKSTPLAYNPLFLFQSSEEVLPGGASAMLQNAILQQLAPAFCLALHSDPDLSVGTIGTRKGAFLASGDEIEILVTGRGGHGARPHLGDDSLLTAAHILVALQNITSRYMPPEVPTTLSFGKLEHQGAMNIFPKQVRLHGTLRTHSSTWRQKACQLIQRIATHTAQAQGMQAQVTIHKGYPPLANHEQVTEGVLNTLQAHTTLTLLTDLSIRMTTDDFAYFAQSYPALMLRLGVGPTSQLHTPTFCAHDHSLQYALMALVALIEHGIAL